MVYYLVDEAIKIIEKARSTKNTKNITGTQWDSFGAAVFYNGKLYYTLRSSDPAKDLTRVKRYMETYSDESGGRHKGWGDIPAGTGREWVNLFVQEAKTKLAIPKQGFALIVFNAAFYSKRQERGYKLKRKYQIISQVVGDLKALESKFKGAKLTGINISIG